MVASPLTPNEEAALRAMIREVVAKELDRMLEAKIEAYLAVKIPARIRSGLKELVESSRREGADQLAASIIRELFPERER